MIYETKFNRGDSVLLLNNDKLLRRIVRNIQIYNDRIRYEFVIRAGNPLDREDAVWRDEDCVYTDMSEIQIED